MWLIRSNQIIQIFLPDSGRDHLIFWRSLQLYHLWWEQFGFTDVKFKKKAKNIKINRHY